MVKIRTIATAIFNCCCLILAAYMTIKQIGTYLRNEDESVISFEEVKETSSEDFATYTICLLMDNGAGMYKHDELIYSKRHKIDEFGLGTSNNFLELDGNKLIVQNMSNRKGTGRQWSFYSEDDPLYGNWETNFYYDQLYNPSRCDLGEIEYMPRKVDVESFVNCQAEKKVVKTYDQHIHGSRGSLIAFKRDEKVYAVDYYQYHDILMGSSTLFKFDHICFEGEFLMCKMVPIKYSLEDVLNIDFDKNTEELSLFLLSHDIEYMNGSKKSWFTELYRKIESNHSLSLEMKEKESRNFFDAKAKAIPEDYTRLSLNPLIKVYQDPTRKCYSPGLNQTLQKKKERITLNIDKMSQMFELSYGGPFVTAFLEIHIHPQGQFVRTIGKEIATYIMEDFFVDCLEMGMGYFGGTACHGSSISFDFSHLTLLKSRHDAEISCDKNLRDEDTRIIETLLNHTGIRCIPIYWKSLVKNQLNYSECTNESQYKMISELTAKFASYERLRSNFDPPCMEMMIVTNVNKEPGRPRRFYDIQEDRWELYAEEMLYLDIAINHFSEQYQAIINTKVFTVESCWAGIGGFFGIFIGVSLMQVPEIIMEIINLMMKLKEKV